MGHQLPGRGVFFAPAVADLQGDGASTIFAVVRGAGSTGTSLYALDATGRVVDELALPGGGGGSPILCRFAGRSEVSLVALSSRGQLLCYRLEQRPASAKILWPGVRNDLLNSGFVKSARPAARTSRPPAGRNSAKPQIADLRSRNRALGGTNRLLFPQTLPGVNLVSLRTVCPDHSIRVDLIRPEPDAKQVTAAFVASTPGDYEVRVRWHDVQRNAIAQQRHFIYHLDRGFKADAARVAEGVGELKTLGLQTPALANLIGCFPEAVTAALARARRTKDTADFDELHWTLDYSLRLARYCRDRGVSGNLLVQQLPNPWANFDAAEFLSQEQGAVNSIGVSMLGNAFQSAAFALVNLRPQPATLRLTCGPFQAGTKQVEARQVLALREVLRVRPDGTGDLTEDPLPLLGEGQTVRLDAGETRKLWLTFRSQGLSPGTWRAVLKIGSVATSESPAETPVTVEVYPVRLPDQWTYRECNWLYLDGIRDAALREATLQDALEHGMNVFVIPGVSTTGTN